MIIFLSISLNICSWCSKEPSHQDGSFEQPQHMFWLRNKKNNFQLRTLILGSDLIISRRHKKQTFSGQQKSGGIRVNRYIENTNRVF